MLKLLFRLLSIFLIVFFLIVGVFFAIRNPQPLVLDLVFWRAPELSAALYILIAFAVGALLAFFAGVVALIRADRLLRQTSKQLSKCRLELDALRKESLTKEFAVGEE